MTEPLYIDFETYGLADLKKAGADVYARHPETGVWCVGWAFGGDPVEVADIKNQETWGPIVAHATRGGTVVSHNAVFELLIWNHVLALRYGWAPLKPEQVVCTMAMAYAMALPGALENAAPAAGIDAAKDMKGHRVMLQLSQPRAFTPEGKPIWWSRAEHPEKFATLHEYCRQDVAVERELHRRLLPLSEKERRVWLMDWKINQRGIRIDTENARKAMAVVEEEKVRLDKAMRKVTGNAVATCTAVGQLADWLRYQGVAVPSLAKADVTDLLADKTIPPVSRKALLLRQEAAKSSTAKLASMLEGVGADGRARGLFQYHGANTGRWAGRRIQLQNFPRPSMDQDAIDLAFEAMGGEDDLAAVLDTQFGPPLRVISDCLRGFLVPERGKTFIGADFSAIEARVLAWLAGEERVLDIFRTHGKIYEHAAAGIYRKDMAVVTKDERQVGKVAILALGYQGGIGAFQKMARAYGVVVSDERADTIKTAWREDNPNIKRYWYALEDAAVRAAITAETTKAGAKGREVHFRRRGSFLWCLLPSGRRLCYPYPRVETIDTPWGEPKDALTYQYVDALTRQWTRGPTYGGSLAENVTQAVARDLLADAMLRLEDAGYPIVLHAHDEVLCEVPFKTDPADVAKIMAASESWAKDLPVEAEIWTGGRYRK